MTPLAQHIIREFLKDKKTNRFRVSNYNLPELLLDDCHCYDVTEVLNLGIEMMLVKKDRDKIGDGKYVSEESVKKIKSITELTYFTPSAKTWIEAKVKVDDGIT